MNKGFVLKNISQQISSLINQRAFWGILLLGLIFRIYGIYWGMPNSFHPLYSYHPDEIYLLTRAEWLKNGQIIPELFSFGGTFYFITLQVTNLIGGLIAKFADGPKLFHIIEFGRFLSVCYALVTIYLTYQIGKLLFGRQVGLIAALILSLSPGHIFWAQRIRPDILFTLLYALNCFFIARIYQGAGSSSFNIALGGLFLGLSIATRFPAVVLYPGYTVAFYFSNRNQHSDGALLHTGKFLFALLCVSCLGYFLSSPHTVVYFQKFISGLQLQWKYQAGQFIDAIGRGPGWYQYGGRIFSQSLGYPFYALMLFSLGLSIWRRRKEDLLLLTMIIPYFFMLSMASWIVVRYTVPLLPLFSILIGRLLVAAYKRQNLSKGFVISITALSIAWTMAANMAYIGVLIERDARDTAAEWIAMNVKPGSTIGAFVEYAGDYFNNPPAIQKHRWSYSNLKFDNVSSFLNFPFDYVVTTEQLLRDVRRLGEKHPRKAYRRLFSWDQQHPGYILLNQFSNNVTVAGLDFGFQFTSIDYMVARPHIYIYRRIKNSL